MRFPKELVPKLNKCEIEFVEELHRIAHEPEKVEFLTGKNQPAVAGWLIMPAEAGSGDWNMARMIGAPDVALSFAHLLPEIELQLLVPDTIDEAMPESFSFAGAIDYFSSKNVVTDEPASFAYDDKLLIREKIEASRNSFAVYLLCNEKIVGYIRSTRFSVNFVEVYIEVLPDWREKGLGSWLLQRAVSIVRSWQKELIYVVERTNEASLATAKTCGLHKFMSLDRYIGKR